MCHNINIFLKAYKKIGTFCTCAIVFTILIFLLMKKSNLKFSLAPFYLAQDVLILIVENPFQGPLEWMSPENQDFFGPWNGNEQSEGHLGPKMSRFSIYKCFVLNQFTSYSAKFFFPYVTMLLYKTTKVIKKKIGSV